MKLHIKIFKLFIKEILKAETVRNCMHTKNKHEYKLYGTRNSISHLRMKPNNRLWDKSILSMNVLVILFTGNSFVM